MNWLPSPPTDSLYKFIAISGLRLLLGLVFLFAWLGYLNYQIEKEGKRIRAYFFSNQIAFEIETSLASIEAKRISENKLQWVPPGFDVEQEVRLLKRALDNHRQTIDKNKDVLDRQIGEEVNLLNSMGFIWIMPIYVVLALGLTFFGFISWYRKIQRPNEDANDLDKKIKEASLRKIEAEIRQTSKIQRPSARRH